MRRSLFVLLALLAACGGAQDFETCVEDRKAMQSEVDAIASCLVDDLMIIREVNSQVACEAYVQANGEFGTTRAEGCRRALERFRASP